jgi:protein involved in polysaccharide export with SLBB domain
MPHWPRIFLFMAGLIVSCSAALFPSTAVGQVPSRQEIERLLQDPTAAQAIQGRIRQSGLSEDEIRGMLQAAGYPPDLLNEYLGRGQAILATPGDSTIQAMAILGLGTADELQAYADSLRLEALVARPEEEEKPDSILDVFGLDVFRRPTTQFLPNLAGPVDEQYRLGPGDVMVIILTGDVELAHTLEVTRQGFVLVPQVGQVFVNSLTLEQARTLLRQRLARSYSGVRSGTTSFEVTVARVRMIQVFVIGEVATPGSYQIPSVSTVVTALYHAGGPAERGNFRQIVVRRGADTVTVFDLYDYLLTGTARGDIRLESGDVVFVPVHGPRVAMTGAVVRPAIYELRPGQTLADLVAAAGGFRADAELRRVAVHRILPAPERGPGPFPRAVVDVPLTPASADGAEGEREPGTARFGGMLVPALRLEDGDSVVVDSILSPEQSLYVSIGGMVNKPGRYPWSEAMTLRDLVQLARGPEVGAYLEEAEIARMPGSREQGELAHMMRVPLDSSYLYERDSSGRYVGAAGLPFPAPGTAPEVVLEPFDQVMVLRQPEFELQRTVTVTGEVRFPGPYALTSKDERVSDLLERAGGVLPTAYVDGGRFYRELDDAGRIDVNLSEAITQPGDGARHRRRHGTDERAVPRGRRSRVLHRERGWIRTSRGPRPRERALRERFRAGISPVPVLRPQSRTPAWQHGHCAGQAGERADQRDAAAWEHRVHSGGDGGDCCDCDQMIRTMFRSRDPRCSLH